MRRLVFTRSIWPTPTEGPFLVANEAGPVDRAQARLRSQRLDRALATGAPDEASPALALRARRLIALPQRRSIAQSYRRIVRESLDVEPRSRQRVIPDRRSVVAAGQELTMLADALSQPGPVAARGVAEARLLLADGTGPLYNGGSGGNVRDCAVRATQHLALV